ncbi:MAG: helix-turn-helix transcriptional regulator [Clostridia bacterium]|nr:helix-turn-helix transcriptional regulator [Clostridia bacterium]
MDYNKIGNLIMTERKAKKLTQAKLAEKIFVSEKTISKWENGNGIPDTSTLPKLCEIFEISINELLNGERLSADSYTSKAEQTLLVLQKEKEARDKMLLTMEIVIGALSIIILLSFCFIAIFLPMENWLQILLIILGLAISLVGVGFALKIEQVAGFYVCRKCNHKHVPSYSQVLFAMHNGRTRYLKCPHCGKRSWQRKVIK